MSIVETIAALAEEIAYEAPVLNPARYPLTYAYDFARSHAVELGLHRSVAGMDRSQMGPVVRSWAERNGERIEDVLVALADAYLAEYGYVDDPETRAAALSQAREKYWRALGYARKPEIAPS